MKALEQAAYEDEGKRIIRSSWSLCPLCAEEENYGQVKIPSVIYEFGGGVWQEKHCVHHGVTKDVYWEDYEMYIRASKYRDNGLVIENQQVSQEASCPLACGLCSEHRSHTALGNIVVTNRCNLACWYCFFYAKDGESIYEPSCEQIRGMLRNLRDEKPVGADAVQFTGGEPTLREDLIEIIMIAKEEGFDHVLINTNGIRIAQDPELAREIKKAGSVDDGNIILYMSFDGVTPRTNPKNYWDVPKALENCRKAGLQVVLVPTVIRGVNDHEIGDILRFAAANLDVVRGVNFQPVSLIGRMDRKGKEGRRITIPGVIKRLEEHLGGVVTRDDFYPVPSVCGITDFMELLSDERKYRLSTHFACGMATYLLEYDGELRPITHFIDVGRLLESLKKFRNGSKAMATLRALPSLRRCVKRTPENFRLLEMLYRALVRADYTPFLELQRNSLFIGMMHFQDLYNYDIERVKRCNIHYATPDGRVIPFCAFNVLPKLYRDKIQEKFSIPAREWEASRGTRLADDRCRRSFSEKAMQERSEYYKECISAGSRRIGHALGNFLGNNALKFTDEGGRVTVESEKGKNSKG